MKSAYQKYKKTSVESAGRETLLIMMYEAAIRNVKKAIVAAESKDIAGRGQNIGSAFDIVMELNNTLDHKVGGDLAKNLEQLYMFMTDQLTKANATGQVKPLQDVLKILEILLSGWREAVEKLKREEVQK